MTTESTEPSVEVGRPARRPDPSAAPHSRPFVSIPYFRVLTLTSLDHVQAAHSASAHRRGGTMTHPNTDQPHTGRGPGENADGNAGRNTAQDGDVNELEADNAVEQETIEAVDPDNAPA